MEQGRQDTVDRSPCQPPALSHASTSIHSSTGLAGLTAIFESATPVDPDLTIRRQPLSGNQ